MIPAFNVSYFGIYKETLSVVAICFVGNECQADKRKKFWKKITEA